LTHQKIEGIGLIVENKDRKFKLYMFAMDTKYITSLMKNYHTNIWNKWSNRFVEMFLSMSNEEED